MVKNYFTAIAVSLLAVSGNSFAQNAPLAEHEEGGQYPLTANDAAHPCITPQQYEIIEKRVAENIRALKLDQKPMKTTSTLFAWPLRAAAGLADCSYYYIGNYVDEDLTSPGIKDYHCGTVTYDGHRGTDICTAPYPFLKMDNNQVEAIAAAPGTIVDKQEGHFDKNCAMNSDTANYIIIQHADGSCALYWHFKKNSVTTKLIGQTVALGEYLGVAGSSGSSTAPHLHFEVWSSTLSSSLKDPWAGTCNSMGGATWWTAQKPYTEHALLKAQVNKILAVLPGCDTTETPNEDSCFTAGSTAKFYFFLRNETIGDTVHERIANPGGSTFTSWTHNSIANYIASYWYFNKVLPATPGIYTYETVYNGTTCTKTFMVECGLLGTAPVAEQSQVTVFPNPAGNAVTISANDLENGNYQLCLRNVVGQVAYNTSLAVDHNNLEQTISLAGLPDGVWIVSIESEKIRIVKKIIKER